MPYVEDPKLLDEMNILEALPEVSNYIDKNLNEVGDITDEAFKLLLRMVRLNKLPLLCSLDESTGFWSVVLDETKSYKLSEDFFVFQDGLMSKDECLAWVAENISATAAKYVNCV
jgi:hypothetical protein